jgi:hypothetical protein
LGAGEVGVEIKGTIVEVWEVAGEERFVAKCTIDELRSPKSQTGRRVRHLIRRKLGDPVMDEVGLSAAAVARGDA